MSHGRVETVVIESDNGPVVINKSDFDEKKHALFKKEKAKPKAKAKKVSKYSEQ